MKTVVITGGTSGIGRALAHTCLDRGDQVVVVAPNPAKGEAFLDRARQAGAGDRAHFIQADLSLVAETRRVVAEIAGKFPVVDALVLCARYFRSHRAVTAEGFEHNFALYYLSRYVIGYGLVDQLDRAANPVVVNVAGPGVVKEGVRWDDLQLERDYDGWASMEHGGRLSDLLGVSFAGQGHRARYVLLFPGGISTEFAGEFDPASAVTAEEKKRAGDPVESSIPRIVDHIDSPPREPLSAFMEDTRLEITGEAFDRDAAARLADITRDLLRDKLGVS
ncbi:SDR family NAD(P)-dependent oxidoreductase [Saccharothrix obliqua]|uniref:SDR family NAD(P)-dependent oxidoreductase n=1 Tax=Saccharothrix obliqua TaxID=2861747 RepID=UPI001C600033|nr:SDR family NAD(P)-dependent oxidoreductase [Saccharothrix obliqua]MBW4718623.1 SDR family NAD(P)-dependent oxidoreductase [Saccharothrix obliqua]